MTPIYLILFFIGLGFGSFASVIIHRLHTKEKGIVCGRSKCPKCKHVLDAVDLIPLFGFIINKAKCKYCKKPISYRYPILELIMGSSFALTAYLTGFNSPWLLAYYTLLTFIFVLISFYDIYFQEIPDEVSLPTIIFAGIVTTVWGLHDPMSLLTGFLVPVLFFGTMFFGSGGKWIGGGDIRVGAIMGIVLGWPNIIIGLFLGYVLGSVISLVGLATRQLDRKSPIPFGPFLFLGTYLAMFWGKDIMNWYLGMM